MTKTQLVDYIVNNFEEPNGDSASRSKIEGFKKGELEEFIEAKASLAEAEEWVNNAN